MIDDNKIYKLVFEKNDEAIIIIEPTDFSLIVANEKARGLLGLKDNYRKIQIKEFKNILEKLKRTKTNVFLLNEKFRLSNNEEICLQVNSKLIGIESRKLILAVLKPTDEIDNLTEKLIQADKLVLLGQLSAGIAHEIRNPLAAVNLNLQLLSRKFAEGTNEYNSIQTALQGVERISRIVEITLNFSKPAKADIREIDINTLVNETLDLVSAEIKKKESNIQIKLSKNLPVIKADAKQIQQVLINLLTNAADAIEKKGKIIIRTGLYNHQAKGIEKVYFEVEDSGIGISEEEIMEIFNPFFTKKTNGTGLGLTISKRIVNEHNGKIEVFSEIGKGTKFKVVLPIENFN